MHITDTLIGHTSPWGVTIYKHYEEVHIADTLIGHTSPWGVTIYKHDEEVSIIYKGCILQIHLLAIRAHGALRFISTMKKFRLYIKDAYSRYTYWPYEPMGRYDL